MLESIKNYYKRSQFSEHPTEGTVAAFEREWQCSLPEEFRSFILEFGCGGGNFGTYGGFSLLPMTFWFDSFPFDEKPPKNWLVEPCPITHDLKVMDLDSDIYAHIDKTPLPNEYDPVLGNYYTEKRIHNLKWEIFKDWKSHLSPYKLDAFQGCITISYGGCTYYDALVVTGPARGSILHMECEGYSMPFWSKAKNFVEYCKRA